MSELLKYFGLYSIGTVLIVSVVGYLAKKIIEFLLNKDLEKFKNELTSENERAKLKFEKDLESYRADLNLIYSKQIKLYSKKSDIIENLYHKLVDLNNSMRNLTRPFRNISGKDDETIHKEEIERIVKAEQDGAEFFNFYIQNKIYFKPKICELIENLQTQFLNAHFDHSYVHLHGGSSSEMTFEMAKNASDKVKNTIPKLMEKVETDFRETLGVIEADFLSNYS